MLLLFSGCKKFEEGPLLSIRSPERRLEGEWFLRKCIMEGNDSTESYYLKYGTNFYFNFQLHNCYPDSFIQYGGFGVMKGNAEFDLKNTKLLLGYDKFNLNAESLYVFPLNANDYVTFEIKKLSNNKLNIESEINNCNYRFELAR